MLALTGLEIYTTNETIPDGTLIIDDRKIACCGPSTSINIPEHAHCLQLSGLKAFPGLIDLHTHGLLGHDAFSSELAEVIRLLPRFGVTSFLATTITLPPDKIQPKLAEMAKVLADPPVGAHCLGIHLEGPHLSPRYTGMANASWTMPLTRAGFEDLQEASGGYIKMVTFAPEEAESIQLIPYLWERGVIPSIGHSNASYELVEEAKKLGLRHATHTFNAMNPFHQRVPGVVGAVMAFPEIIAELIADGQHVHPGSIRTLLNAKRVEGVCLVSDSSPFAGLPPGRYEWEGYSIMVDGETCRLEEGNLAGSHALLDTGFHNLIETIGLTPEQAAVCASTVPARVMGLEQNIGSILPGQDADIFICDNQYQVKITIGHGQILWQDSTVL